MAFNPIDDELQELVNKIEASLVTSTDGNDSLATYTLATDDTSLDQKSLLIQYFAATEDSVVTSQ